MKTINVLNHFSMEGAKRKKKEKKFWNKNTSVWTGLRLHLCRVCISGVVHGRILYKASSRDIFSKFLSCCGLGFAMNCTHVCNRFQSSLVLPESLFPLLTMICNHS